MSIFPSCFSSVLKTFIHDPLVEWEKIKGRGSSAETSNEKVQMCVIQIVAILVEYFVVK